MHQESIAIGAECERDVERFRVAKGLLHARANRVVVVLGLGDAECDADHAADEDADDLPENKKDDEQRRREQLAAELATLQAAEARKSEGVTAGGLTLQQMNFRYGN